ncbi:MAG: DUF1592 domain-containing protein [Planctomycetales bacterium]|nr:DUF1592 domain-containing protein [Planctomycetales bacterium]
MRVYATVAIVVCLLPVSNTNAQLHIFDDATQSFLKTHCVRCHGESKQEGEFRIDTLETDFTDPQAAQKWSEVLFRINAGEMPPPEEAQPSPQEIGSVADSILEKIRQGAAARMARRGPVEFYRLSRTEYAQTIYDLLGVVFDVEAPGAFNDDPRWHGFDRVGALLSVAPSHIERYFDAANTVVETAFPDTEIPAKADRHLAGEGKRKLLQLGESWEFSISRSGRYRVRIRASGLPAFTGRVPRLSLWHKHHQRTYAGRELNAPEDAPQTVEFEGLYPAGQYQVRNHARTKKHANGGIQLFRNETIDANQSLASLTGGQRSPWTKVVDEQGKPTTPLLLVDWIEIEGPLLTDADRAKRAGIFPADNSGVEEQRTRLQRFATRAWRRPVSEAEIEPYVRLIATEQRAGESLRAACRSALTSILVSRSFFNLEQGFPTENRQYLNDFELASRLSYFLWSSMPDEQLFAAARDGKLTSHDGLAKELERMLNDPKIERFLDSFPKQWLQLHRVGMFQPDPGLYPEYGPWLEESMVKETTAYFSELFNKNLPLRELIDSNWTMLDQRLAMHYGFDQPAVTTMTRVEVPADSGRGGILTHGSILSLTSDGTRHRPVHRGAWLSEAILAYTPPPPPPNVDPLEPVASDEPKTTIRSKLQAHASQPNCVSCHAKIDPLGLAFENFDAIGRWREFERVAGGVGENPSVDASGVLPDGRKFAGPAEFKKLLAEDEDRLAQAFLEQLATYALRRVITIDDAEHLRSIVESASKDEYRVQTLVRGLVMSELFKQR